MRVVEEILAQLKSEAFKIGLYVNANKSKNMRIMRNSSNLKENLNIDALITREFNNKSRWESLHTVGVVRVYNIFLGLELWAENQKLKFREQY